MHDVRNYVSISFSQQILDRSVVDEEIIAREVAPPDGALRPEFEQPLDEGYEFLL